MVNSLLKDFLEKNIHNSKGKIDSYHYNKRFPFFTTLHVSCSIQQCGRQNEASSITLHKFLMLNNAPETDICRFK